MTLMNVITIWGVVATTVSATVGVLLYLKSKKSKRQEE
jgi:hypothetical protein